MALDIDDLFDADPKAEQKAVKKFVADWDAEMKGGYYDADEKRVKNLTQFLFKFNKPDTASAFAELFGGTWVEDEDSPRDFNIDLFSSAGEVDGYLSAADVVCDMRQFNMGKLVHHCTGTKFISHPMNKDMIGQPCGCPKSVKQRKDAAKNHMGPSPYIEFKFRLARDESFKVKYVTHSWVLMKNIRNIINDIIVEGQGADAWVTFSKESISWENEDGESLSAIIPKADVRGSANAAIAA